MISQKHTLSVDLFEGNFSNSLMLPTRNYFNRWSLLSQCTLPCSHSIKLLCHSCQLDRPANWIVIPAHFVFCTHTQPSPICLQFDLKTYAQSSTTPFCAAVPETVGFLSSWLTDSGCHSAYNKTQQCRLSTLAAFWSNLLSPTRPRAVPPRHRIIVLVVDRMSTSTCHF